MADAATKDDDREFAAGMVSGPLDRTLLSGTFDLEWLAIELAQELHARGDAFVHGLAAGGVHGLVHGSDDRP